MTDARLTQEAVEQWAMPDARAQVTQLAAEEWGTVVSGARLALMTSISLEMWANVPSLARPMQTGVAINTA